MSIKRTLLTWLLVGLIAAGLVSGGVTYELVCKAQEELLHDELRQFALALEEGLPPIATGAKAGAGRRFARKSVVYELSDASGAIEYRSPGAPPLSQLMQEGFDHVSYPPGTWHVYAHPVGSRVLRVAQLSLPGHMLSTEAALLVLLPVLALIPVLGLLIVFAVRRSHAPLAALVAATARRDADNLDPLPLASVPEEILPLAKELNSLLARVGEAILSQRQFLSDAAHALRTPLTSLRLELGNLRIASGAALGIASTAAPGVVASTHAANTSVPARNPAAIAHALQRLDMMAEQASRLVSQLLNLAREEGAGARSRAEPVELRSLLTECIVAHLTLADHRRIDLGFTRALRATVLGEREPLLMMLGALVDNAIRYAPAGSVVDVAMDAVGDGIAFEIRDAGPGIPEPLLERVFDRFFRVEGGAIEGSTVEGSGLGLAVAKAIADRHGARISLRNREGGGLAARVEFPHCVPNAEPDAATLGAEAAPRERSDTHARMPHNVPEEISAPLSLS
jgi:two-component system, OmpR family, sensor kinase